MKMGVDCQASGKSITSAFRPVALLIADSRRIGLSRLDAGLDLQPASHRLVVLHSHLTGLDVGLDFQSTRHRPVVLSRYITGLDVGLDFQAPSHGLVVL